MKKLALIILCIMVAGAVSAAGVENMVLEAEPLVEQANISSEQKSVFLQLIAILAAWFLLLRIIHFSRRFPQSLKHQAIRIAPKSHIGEFMAHKPSSYIMRDPSVL